MRIQELRKARGLSQSALARRARMHVSSVCAIEQGRLLPYPGQLKKLAKALHVTVSDLQGEQRKTAAVA